METKDLLKLTYQDIIKFKKPELLEYTKQLKKEAIKRRADLKYRVKYTNEPTPTAAKAWKPKKPNSKSYSYGQYGEDELSYLNVKFKANVKMSLPELRQEFKLAQNFLNTKTSTREGWKETLNDFVERVGYELGTKIDKEYYDKFWEVYNKVKSTLPAFFSQGAESKVRQQQLRVLLDDNKNANIDKIIDSMIKKIKEFENKKDEEKESDASSPRSRYKQRRNK